MGFDMMHNSGSPVIWCLLLLESFDILAHIFSHSLLLFFTTVTSHALLRNDSSIKKCPPLFLNTIHYIQLATMYDNY